MAPARQLLERTIHTPSHCVSSVKLSTPLALLRRCSVAPHLQTHSELTHIHKTSRTRRHHLYRNTQLSASSEAAEASGDGIAASPRSSSETQAVFNVVNVMMGVGLLSLPFALKSSGWVGLVLLWLMGFVANYTAKSLVECANIVAKRQGNPGKAVSYEEIADATFGHVGKLFISTMIYVELFGTCCLLYILEGDNLHSLFGTSSLANSPDSYMLLAAAAIIPTLWLPDVGALSFLGLAGVAATCTVAAAVTYTLATGSFAPGAETHFANWATLPLVFGIMTFCFSGHGVFPAIQASMRDPQRFPHVLNIAYLIVAGICTLIGGVGYYMYGTGALDVVTFNLPKGFLAALCASVILINPVAKFAITLEPVSQAAQSVIAGNGPALPGFKRAAVRTLLALAVLAAARSVPFLASLMALIGSFLTISVSITLPAVCHQLLHSETISQGRTMWNFCVALLGLLCAFFGTQASIRSLAAKAAAASMTGAPA